MKLSRWARWAVPGTAVAVTGVVIAASQMTIAQAAPELPARTAAQLLVFAGDKNMPPLTGTVVETTSLGLPQLPRAANTSSLSSLITGSHTVNIYYQSPQHFRVQVPQTMSETDAIRDGNTLWLWDSTRNAITQYTAGKGAANGAAGRLPATPQLTPQQAADQVLKAVGKTTTVAVQRNVWVAGRPSYQLVLAPKDKRSLIGQVVIAVDGKYGVPLRLQVFARHATSPAFQVGYTQISFVTPAAQNLRFAPPSGATLKKVDLGSATANQASGTGTQTSPATTGYASYGSGWLAVAEFPQSAISANTPVQLPGGGGPLAGSSSQALSPQQPSGSGQVGMGALGGSGQEILHALMQAAKPVHGKWGSGTLLTTGLMSMLITHGEVYVGAVQPSVLYAAAGHTPAGHAAG